MHPAQLTRAATSRRALTPAETRQAMRDAANQPPLTAAPPCAFHATRGVGSSIRVARAFSVIFAFSGISVAFDAGTGVRLHRIEAWQPHDKMVIVIDKVWGTRDHCLIAMREAELVEDEQLRSFIVGGFDLDRTGAVLAGSFWDANLGDDAAQPEVGAPNPVISRMADLFVDRQRDGFDDITHTDLVREGFSEREVMQHYAAATVLAAERLRDADCADSRTTYDRQARVMHGATALAGEMDPNRVHTTLRLAGLSTQEIGHLFDDIIGETMRLVREGNAALAAVGPTQSQSAH